MPVVAISRTLIKAFLSPCASADRPNTIQHWQLRDLIHCHEHDDIVYCVARRRTLKYDTKLKKVRTRMAPAALH